MGTEDEFDRLIGVLYEVVTEPSRWPAALELCATFVGGIGAHLLSIDKKDNRVVLSLHGGAPMTEQNIAAYLEHFINIDPRQTSGMMNDAAPHEWRACHAYLDKRFVSRNEFYQDFLVPQGSRYSMGAWVDDGPERHTLVGLHRSPDQAPFGVAERAAARRFSPHVQRALRLCRHTQELHAKAELGIRAIEALALPMLIVDGDARILHMNAAAEHLLKADGSHLIYLTNCLTSVDPGNESKLAALITAATGSPAVGGAMMLSRAKPWQVWVAPLPAASPIVHDWQRALALVVVQAGNGAAPNLPVDLADLSPAELREASAWFGRKSPKDATQEAVNHFVHTYRLTGREAKVLQCLMEGYSPKEIAERHGVSHNTVRSQLASLMRKTDCRRQKDLIRLFLRWNP